MKESTLDRLPAEASRGDKSAMSDVNKVDAVRSTEFEKATTTRFRPDAQEGFNPFAEEMSAALSNMHMGGTGQGRTDGGVSAAAPRPIKQAKGRLAKMRGNHGGRAGGGMSAASPENNQMGGGAGHGRTDSGMSAAALKQNEQIEAEQGVQGLQDQGHHGAKGEVNPALPHLPMIDIPIPKPDGIRLPDVDAFLWNFSSFVSYPLPPFHFRTS